MKAAVITRFGSEKVLTLTDLPKPEIKANQLLVKVNAAAVNPKDTFIRKGRFKKMTGSRFPMQTGFDFSGTVESFGNKTIGFKVGDPVFGMLNGWQGKTCAEYAAIPADQLTHKPAALSFEQAAALPLVSMTALQALRDKAGIRKGQKVCINGASGGVGSMAVQIAKIFKTKVTAIASRRNHDLLKSLGADLCVDYLKEDIRDKDFAFDIYFDVFGNHPFKTIKPILSKKGVWVTTVVQPHVFISLGATWFFSEKKAKLVVVGSNRPDLEQIKKWTDAGRLKPLIHDIYPLDKIPDAHKQQETKHTKGKIVIKVKPG